MLLLHGLNEHSGRYEHVGDALVAAGLHVVAHDHRGHGGSSGRRSYIGSFDEFLDDVEDHLAVLRAADDAGLLVLLGHSMGGLIAHAYCVSGRPPPDLLVSSGAPLSPVGVPRWQRKLAGPLARIVPTLRVGRGFDPAVLSRDPNVAAAYLADPLVGRGVTAALGSALFDGMDRCAAHAGPLALPALVLHGEVDELVPPQATEGLVGVPGVERRLVEGARHEIFNDVGWQVVLRTVVDWLRARRGDVPSLEAT